MTRQYRATISPGAAGGFLLVLTDGGAQVGAAITARFIECGIPDPESATALAWQLALLDTIQQGQAADDFHVAVALVPALAA